jgi:hypothetical protein
MITCTMMIQTCRSAALNVELIKLEKADLALRYFPGGTEEF